MFDAQVDKFNGVLFCDRYVIYGRKYNDGRSGIDGVVDIGMARRVCREKGMIVAQCQVDVMIIYTVFRLPIRNFHQPFVNSIY